MFVWHKNWGDLKYRDLQIGQHSNKTVQYFLVTNSLNECQIKWPTNKTACNVDIFNNVLDVRMTQKLRRSEIFRPPNWTAFKQDSSILFGDEYQNECQIKWPTNKTACNVDIFNNVLDVRMTQKLRRSEISRPPNRTAFKQDSSILFGDEYQNECQIKWPTNKTACNVDIFNHVLDVRMTQKLSRSEIFKPPNRTAFKHDSSILLRDEYQNECQIKWPMNKTAYNVDIFNHVLDVRMTQKLSRSEIFRPPNRTAFKQDSSILFGDEYQYECQIKWPTNKTAYNIDIFNHVLDVRMTQKLRRSEIFRPPNRTAFKQDSSILFGDEYQNECQIKWPTNKTACNVDIFNHVLNVRMTQKLFVWQKNWVDLKYRDLQIGQHSNKTVQYFFVTNTRTNVKLNDPRIRQLTM